MLGILVKKQLAEVFRSYFYNAKKNKMRSKGAIAGWFVFFGIIMVGVLGGIFTALSLSICGALTKIGMGWLYFLVVGGISVVIGAFGSVFNTYAGLYLARDNDLLLSLPIPARTIIAARLINVYLMGAMYSATAFLPALIVYWATAGATAARVICGVLQFAVITLIVLLLSALLGWVVARISLKLKNKSFITVLVSLLFIGGYYFVYFKANDLIRDVVMNAALYGTRIKGAAHALYLFGRIGEGDWTAAAICLGATAALSALAWTLLARSFLSIATDSGSAKKVRYVEKAARGRTVFGALLYKEFARFAASPNYMLNCGLATLLIPVGGVLLLIRGREFFAAIDAVFAARPGSGVVLVCTALCLLASMNDMAAPSVSLEGKSLWIPQSLPIAPGTALRAKALVQLILTALPLLFAAICAAAIARASVSVRLFICAMPLLYASFSAVAATAVGVSMPILNWTSEVAPIKQSGAVAIAMLGGWAVCIIFGGLYLLVGYRLGAALYLLLWSVALAAASALLLRWLDTRGAAAFAAL